MTDADRGVSRAGPDVPPARSGTARAVAWLFGAVYAAYSSFGIAAPFWWGHHGYHGATYMLRARMSLRFGMLTPATWTGYDPPPLPAYYFHHPIGYHHLLTALIPILGEHEWLARGLAAVGGAVALWTIWSLARRAWGEAAAAVAVAAFVSLPIVTSFSVLSDPMLLALGCVVWTLDAYLRYLARPSRRLLALAATANVLGGLLMWEAYFIAPFLALHALGRGLGRRRRAQTPEASRVAVAWVMTTGLACAATMALHFWLTHRAGVLGEFFESYRQRHTPPSAQYVIERHTQWLTLLYGPVPLMVGAAWLVTFLGRILRAAPRARDLVPLTFLYVNVLYIYLFAEGSSVHLYRVFFFSGFFTFALVDLIDGLARALRHAFAARGALRSAAPYLALGVYLMAIGPQAWRNLLESRVVMGTHGHGGYRPDQEKMAFGAELRRRTAPTDRVVIHGSMQVRKEFWYYFDRSFDEIGSLAQLSGLGDKLARSVLILDAVSLVPSERPAYLELLRKHPVTYFDRFALIDLRRSEPGAQGYSFRPVPRARISPAYRWFVSHRYPPLELERRAFVPGLCDALSAGAPIAADEELPPVSAPLPREQQLCVHNARAARGEDAKAAELRRRILDDIPPRAGVLGGAQLVAGSAVKGTLRLAWLAGPDPLGTARPPDVSLRYVVKVGAKESILPSSAALPPPRRWRAGFLYLDTLILPGDAAAGGPVEVRAELVRPAPTFRIPMAPPGPGSPAPVVAAALPIGVL